MVQFSLQAVSTDAERYLLIYTIVVLILVTSLVIVFFVVFQRRKNKILIDKLKQQQRFKEELTQSQIEIQEQTLKNVGQELHDNVGQLLSYANMQLNLISSITSEEIKTKVEDTKNVIGDTIEEVRSLSKSLNKDVISNFGLIKSLQNEVDRINKLDSVKAELNVQIKDLNFDDPKNEIILFRIAQEFISNSIKYSEAELISINFSEASQHYIMELRDNGKGFDIKKAVMGSGLINMKSRAELINTDFSLNSSPGKGTELVLKYPIS